MVSSGAPGTVRSKAVSMSPLPLVTPFLQSHSGCCETTRLSLVTAACPYYSRFFRDPTDGPAPSSSVCVVTCLLLSLFGWFLPISAFELLKRINCLWQILTIINHDPRQFRSTPWVRDDMPDDITHGCGHSSCSAAPKNLQCSARRHKDCLLSASVYQYLCQRQHDLRCQRSLLLRHYQCAYKSQRDLDRFHNKVHYPYRGGIFKCRVNDANIPVHGLC